MKFTLEYLIIALFGLSAVVGAIVILMRRKQKESFELDEDADMMAGSHGKNSHPADYLLPHQPEQRSCGSGMSELTPTPYQEGHGVDHHIVGEKVYACSNDPNVIDKYSCAVDDYNLHALDFHKKFEHNPVYGVQSDKQDSKVHSENHHPYNYSEAGECRCSVRH